MVGAVLVKDSKKTLTVMAEGSRLDVLVHPDATESGKTMQGTLKGTEAEWNGRLMESLQRERESNHPRYNRREDCEHSWTNRALSYLPVFQEARGQSA